MQFYTTPVYVINTSNRYMRDIAADCWSVIDATNDPPSIFRRGQTVAEIAFDDEAYPRVRTLDNAMLTGIPEQRRKARCSTRAAEAQGHQHDQDLSAPVG